MISVNMSELFEFIKSDSIKNLICADKINTHSDIEKAKADGYSVGYTKDELKQVFPNIPADKIWYNNGYTPTFYYDKDKLVIFPVNLYGKQIIETFDNPEDEVIKRASAIEKDLENGDFFSLLMSLQDKMRMELLDILINRGETEKMYEA